MSTGPTMVRNAGPADLDGVLADVSRSYRAAIVQTASSFGIDLTAASVVIHYDRWWNQAREDQATDRVHRIGQNRGVQVIRLITRNTLEETPL